MNGRGKRLSVVIAAYNRGPKIASTLESVLVQTVAPGEILVVDDGSSDETARWIRTNYAPTVQVVDKTNGGTSSARNFGARLAKGELLLFLDHDDDLLPNAVEVLIALIDARPSVVAAFADHTYENTSTGERYARHHDRPSFRRLRSALPVNSCGKVRQFGRSLHRALLHGNVLQQPWMVKREAFERIRGYDESVRLCEDWDLYLRLTQVFEVAVTDEVISNHRVHGGNLHLAAGQEEMHVRVLTKLLRSSAVSDLRSQAVIRRRLGVYFKAWADRCADPPESRRWYRRSAAMWPLDPVVVARAFGLLRSPIVAADTET